MKILLLLLVAFNVQAETQWENFLFGDQNIIYPTHISGKLIPDGAGIIEECNELKGSISKMKLQIQRCNENHPYSCLNLKSYLRSLAQGRLQVSGLIQQKKIYYWNLLQDETIDNAYLPDIKNNILEINYTSDSLMDIYSKYSDFDESDTFDVDRNKLRTRNMLLSCDIIEGKAKIVFNYRRIIKFFDYPSSKIINFAWDTYKLMKESDQFEVNMPNLLKAAIAGHLLGHRIYESKLLDDRINLVSLLNGFLDLDSDEFTFKKYQSKKELSDKILPPIKIEKSVEIIWSNNQ